MPMVGKHEQVRAKCVETVPRRLPVFILDFSLHVVEGVQCHNDKLATC